MESIRQTFQIETCSSDGDRGRNRGLRRIDGPLERQITVVIVLIKYYTLRRRR